MCLREEHGIYMAGSGRINIAGLTTGNIDKFLAALGEVAG
jgi:aromatic-amino-acid transaminase